MIFLPAVQLLLVDWDWLVASPRDELDIELRLARAGARGRAILRGPRFVEYAGLRYPRASHDLAALRDTWTAMRAALDDGARDLFDPFFRRLGWAEHELHSDLAIHVEDARALVLGPRSVTGMLHWWRDDLVDRWPRLRAPFDRLPSGGFTSFDGLTMFVMRWIDAFTIARPTRRGLVAVERTLP